MGEKVSVADVPDSDDQTCDPRMVLPDQKQISPNSIPTTPTSNADSSASCDDDQSNSSIGQGHMFKNTTYLIFLSNSNLIQDCHFLMVNKGYF